MNPVECTPFLQRAYDSLASEEAELDLSEEDWEESLHHVGRCALILSAFLDPAQQHDVPSLVQRFWTTVLANTTPEVRELNVAFAEMLKQKLNVVACA
jgi:hypothetical protein